MRDRISRYAAFGEDVEPPDIGQTWGSPGLVADSIPLALFAARAIGRRNLTEVVGSAVAAGGDTDTIGSLTGQIAGAAVGKTGVPDDLLARLRDLPAIASTAEEFARVVTG